MAIEEVKETSIEDDIMAAIEMGEEPIAEDDADLHNGGAVASEPVQDDSEQLKLPLKVYLIMQRKTHLNKN